MLLPVACTWPYYHVFRLLLWSLGLVSVLSASVLFGLLGRRRRGGRRGIGHLVRATATSPMGLVKKTQIGASFAFSQVPRRVLYYSTTITPEKINIPSYETVLKVATSLEGGAVSCKKHFASGRQFLASYVPGTVGFKTSTPESRRLERGRDLGECVLSF